MPTVPRYNQPQAQPTARPDTRTDSTLPLDAFGGGASFEGVTNAVKGLADVGTKIAEAEKSKADQIAALDADRQLSELETHIQYDSESGAMNKTGRDALGLPDDVRDQWSKSVEEIQKNLHNDTQRLAFKRSEAAHWASLDSNIQKHVATEMKKFDVDTTNALISNEQEAAAANYLDNNRIAESIERQQNALLLHAQRNGLPREWVDQKMAGAASDTHVNVLERMLGAGEIAAARTYYAENKASIVGDAAAKYPDYINSFEARLHANAKASKELAYDANMRQAMLDMFDGKLTLSEAQRRYRNDDLDIGDYNLLEGKMIKPDYALLRDPGLLFSDPSTFAEIRQKQLAGTDSPKAINRQIAQGYIDKKISNDDSKYLTKINNGQPPSQRDQHIDGQANAVRDFATRYFAEHLSDRIPGVPGAVDIQTNKDQAKQDTDAVVMNFLKQVDKEKASGDRIDQIAHEVMVRHVKKRYPEINRLEDIPHVVVSIDGKVKRLLNPDQKTKLKGRYKIVPNGDSRSYMEKQADFYEKRGTMKTPPKNMDFDGEEDR